MILDEIVISSKAPYAYFSTLYLSIAIPFINRICVQDFEYFKNVLSEFLSENKFTFIYFFEIWLSKMEQMISIEARYSFYFKK